MPTAPTAITPLPTAPSRADPANFPTRADAFLAALPTFGSQLNANASAAYTNASDSVTAANNAAASETNAAASAIAAAASALTALNAPGTSGTSTTSLTIGTGSQTFTTQTGKAWVVGQFVTVASTASPTNFMHGQITAYNSGTGSMTVNVLAVGGSGTLASWTIGLVGPNATLTDQHSLQPVALTLPSIRPSLLLDFANSKKLDPRITFTRATSATYYDGVTTAKAEENLLLQSQLFFPPLWTLTNADPTGTLGSELVTNGTFDTDSDWTKGPGWTIGGGEATHAAGTAGNLSQTISLTLGKVYLATCYVVSVSGGTGSLQFRNGGITTAVTIDGTSVGSTVSIFYTAEGNNQVAVVAGAGTTLTVDNVSVKELTVTYATAPDGTTTAPEFTADAANSTITQSVTAIAAEYTFSVWLRRVTGTGNIDITAHSGGTWVTQTITSSWARYTVTQTLTAGSRTPGIRIVTSGDQIEVWGAQFEQRSVATAYTPTTTQPITNYIPQLLTAPSGVPRFDHNPTTGESLGLLVEEQRTNLLTYSEEFDNGAWTKTKTTVTANAAVSPDGTLSADELVNAPTTLDSAGIQSASTAYVSGQYTFSIYLKYKKIQFVQLLFSSVLSTNYVNADLVNGTITAGTYTSATMTSVGNNWYRLSITTTFAAASGIMYVRFVDSGTAIRSATFSGAAGLSNYIWGAQLEAGAFPTSYIPTTSASVTRTTDFVNMLGSNLTSWFSSPSGTFYSDVTVMGEKGTTEVSSFCGLGTTLSNDNMVYFGVYDNRLTTGFVAPGHANISQYHNLTGQRIKHATAAQNFYDSTNAQAVAAINGVIYNDGVIYTSYSNGDLRLFGGANAFAIGRVYRSISTTGVAAGHYRKLAYYPARLTNAELQALTA